MKLSVIALCALGTIGPMLLANTLQISTFTHLGTDYGGWTIPLEEITEKSVCYCVGAGEDISFEVELAQQKKCHVYIFDPTPRAIAHFAELKNRTLLGQPFAINNSEAFYAISESTIPFLHYYPWGLSNTDGMVTFYFPSDSLHVSLSSVNLQNTQQTIDLPCRSLRPILKELGHEKIDLLKMDVEGAEHAILLDMFRSQIFPRILCLELHGSPTLINQSKTLIEVHGYKEIAQKGNDYSYIAVH